MFRPRRLRTLAIWSIIIVVVVHSISSSRVIAVPGQVRVRVYTDKNSLLSGLARISSSGCSKSNHLDANQLRIEKTLKYIYSIVLPIREGLVDG